MGQKTFCPMELWGVSRRTAVNAAGVADGIIGGGMVSIYTI
jgi:hypothetical protein